ncbi:MAG TPA: hypothetical protein VLE96_06605 [Chlamydiales bacterium]|nr:hypothetical protein [Chlamydiales bacterium]
MNEIRNVLLDMSPSGVKDRKILENAGRGLQLAGVILGIINLAGLSINNSLFSFARRMIGLAYAHDMFFVGRNIEKVAQGTGYERLIHAATREILSEFLSQDTLIPKRFTVIIAEFSFLNIRPLHN